MEAKKFVMMEEKYLELKRELQEIQTVKMDENTQKIKEARGQGDLSENAEYDAARDEQAELVARAAEIENILKNAEVVTEDQIDKTSINLGSTVTFLDIELDEEMTYKLVGSIEADSEQGTISIDSPLGTALMNAKVNDIVTVEAPVGEIQYKVLSFTAVNLGDE